MSMGQSRNDDVDTPAPGPSFHAESWGEDPWLWPSKEVWHPWGKIPPLLSDDSGFTNFSAIVESERPAPPKGAFEKVRIGQCTIIWPAAWFR